MSNYDRYPSSSRPPARRPSQFSGLKLRLIIGVVIVLFSVANYMMKGQINPITGQKQRVNLSIEQEIALGRQSAPNMGRSSMNRIDAQRVKEIGNNLVLSFDLYLQREKGERIPYPFEFHLLANEGKNAGSINAFALPGGQVFITESLYRRLDQRHPDELAGVLGHEIGHVLERHSAERMAHTGMLQGLANAAGVAGGTTSSAQVAASVADMVSKKYGREDELESDRWGVRLMYLAGYEPESLLRVMDVLEEAGAGGGPSFLSTHPKPADRQTYIKEVIETERAFKEYAQQRREPQLDFQF